MKPEQRIEQVLMKWLVQCSDCRTIQGAKHIMPRIVQEILTSHTEPEDEWKRFPKGMPSSMEDIVMEYPDTEPEDEPKCVHMILPSGKCMKCGEFVRKLQQEDK